MDRRKNKVNGRIKKLNNSINTIIGISKFTVPNGTKWFKKEFFFLVIDKTKMGVHNIKIITIFKLVWLVKLNKYKFNLKKFKKKIKIKET